MTAIPTARRARTGAALLLLVLAAVHMLHGLHAVALPVDAHAAPHALHHAGADAEALVAAAAEAVHCVVEAIALPSRSGVYSVLAALAVLTALVAAAADLRERRPIAVACRSGPAQRRALLQVFLV